MSEIRLTGNGAPTRMTKGVVGQHYEDLNTGNIYECLVASEQSKLNGAIGGGYVWKLKYTGDDRRDHEAIFGVGGSGGSNMVEKVLYQTDNAEFSDMGGIYAHALSLTGGITASKTYKVELDGTSYECVCKSDKGFGEYVGNESLINPMANDTGEEFLIVHENPNDMSSGYMIMCTKQFTRVKISTMEEKSSGGGGKFVVTATFDLTYNHVTWDKTFDETWAARISGQEVQLKFTDGINVDNYDVCEYEKVDGEPNKLKFAIPAIFDKSTSSLTGRTVEWSKRDNSLVLYIGAFDSRGFNFFEMGTFYPAGIK